MPSAEIIPYPIVRRTAFIRRHAARMADLRESTAEKHLRTQLDLQRKTMLKRGIPAPEIDRQIQSAEAAIRAELWRLVIVGDGGAA